MVIREAGLLFRGFTLTVASYHRTSGDNIDADLRSALLTALVNFAQNAFSKNVEYFEMKKFVIVFIEDKITPSDNPNSETLFSYAILDKEKKIDKFIQKVVQPSLREVIQQFKAKYDRKNLSEISQFKEFKENLDKIFGLEAKTIEQKLNGTLF